jgi:serine protease AprX
MIKFKLSHLWIASVILNCQYLNAQYRDILSLFHSDSRIPVVIVFTEEANLSPAYLIKEKTEKTKFVYETVLRQHEKSVAKFKTGFNVKNYRGYAIANAIVTHISKNEYESLLKNPMVKNILPDIWKPIGEITEIRQELNVSSRNLATTWGIKDSKADSVWARGFQGKGIVIGGQDTGYESNLRQIRKAYRGTINEILQSHHYNWHDAIREKNDLNTDDKNPCGFNSKTPCDDNSHGTHTMGTMVGRDTNEVTGVAPEATWIGCRNMDRGWGKPSTYIECFEWFLAPTDLDNKNPKPSLAPDVINNSWGCPDKEGCNPSNWQVMQRVVATLKAAGIFVVVSAGNDGPNCTTVNNPAAFFKESFSVGAHNISGNIAGFSSRGGSVFDTRLVKPDITAPGVGVRSIVRTGGYANLSGTSMAGPHVAGAVALILSAVPALKGRVEIVEDILRKSAKTTKAEKICNGVDTSAVPNNTFGYGRLDILSALKLAQTYIISSDEEVEDEDITLLPNPTQGILLITVPDAGPFSAEILTLNGNSVSVFKNVSSFISIPDDLPNGIYFIRIYQKEKILVRKLQLMR